MDLSTSTRRIKNAQNLVLYVDVQHDPDGDVPFFFMARINTARTEGSSKHHSKVFHCHGTWQAWTVAPTFITVLLRNMRDEAKFRAMLDSWILETKTMPAGTHRLCVEIRHQSEYEAPRIPTPGVGYQHPTPFVHQTSPFVVYEYVPKKALLERGLTITLYGDLDVIGDDDPNTHLF